MLEHTARAMAIKEERCSVCLKDLLKSSMRRRHNSETFQNPCGDSRRCPYRMQIIFTLFAHQLQCVELEANAPQYQSDSNIAKTSLFVKKKVNPVRQSLELAGRISGLLVQNNGTCCICLMTLPPV